MSLKALFEKEKKYWSQKLEPEDRIITLPYTTHVPKDVAANADYATYTLTFSSDVSSRISSITGSNPWAVYMVLLAGVNSLLHKYTGEEHVLLGIPVAETGSSAAKPLNSMLILKSTLNTATTFKSLLSQIKAGISEAIEHQSIPFWTYTEGLDIPRSNADKPLFHTVVSLHNLHEATWMSEVDAELHMHFKWENDIASLTMTYNNSYYNETAIASFGEQLSRLYAVVLHQPELMLSSVDILSAQDADRLKFTFNDTTVDYPREASIEELFTQQAKQTPYQVALVEEQGSMTYGELDEKSNQLAATLRRAGVALKQPVAIMAERSADMVVGMLAILKAGGVYVPIDPDYPEERVSYLLEDSGAELLLVTRAEHRPLDYKGTILDLRDEDVYGAGQQESSASGSLYGRGDNVGDNIDEATDQLKAHKPLTGGDRLAYIMYTSGTTGLPKGVMVEHRNVVRLVKNTNFAELHADTKILQTGAVVFDASTFEIWGALLNGGQLILVSQDVILNAARLKEAIRAHGVTTMWLTAPLFNQLSQQDVEMFAGLKELLIGGDVLSVPHVNRVLEAYPSLKLINGYGPTENTTFSTTHAISGIQSEAVPIGRPITNSTAYVVDRALQLQPVGAWGELLVGGDGVARGYRNRPDLTAEKFMESPFRSGERCYRTGDLVRWREDGTLEYKGRIDAQVKIRGYRIELGEVEAQLLKLEVVSDAIVVTHEDEQGQKQLCAYVVLQGEAPGVTIHSAAKERVAKETTSDASNEPTSSVANEAVMAETAAIREGNIAGVASQMQELRNALLRELPGYMVPSYFVELKQLPLTPNGKVDRRALPQPERSMHGGSVYEPPRTSMEEHLVSIWQEVLNVERIGIKDNFFEAGGHSLRATHVISLVHRQMHKNLQLKDLFDHPTIEQLAQVLETLEQTGYTAIPMAPQQSYYVLSSAQKRMYILNQLEPDGTSYNIPGAVTLTGPLDVNAMEQAFQELIQRHETLRTSFDTVQGEPVQRLHDKVSFRLAYIEARSADREQTDQLLQDFIRPFELNRAPLFRAGLIAVGADQHILLLDMHHIISDGTSVQVLMQDLVRLYAKDELPALRIQYKDYALWQQEQHRSERYKEQEAYWLGTFAGELPVLDMPTDFPRPAVRSFAGDVLPFSLDARQSAGLKHIAAQTESTLYMVLLAAYTTLLSHYSGQEDIIVGSPIAGRTHAELAPLIGMFVNTLAIRSYPQGSKSFRDYVLEVKGHTLQAFEHQDYPLEELIEKLDLDRDLSRNPLFDTVFALQNLEQREQQLNGLRMEPYPGEQTAAKFDLSLFAFEDGEDIVCGLQYATRLYTQETIQRLALHFRQLVDAIIERPDIALSAIEIITPQEKEQIIKEFNNTVAAYPYPKDLPVHVIFEEYAVRTPEQIAVTFADERLTYQELNERSEHLARILQSRGIRRRQGSDTQRVALMAERSIELIVGMLGILKAGGAYVPVDPDYPEERILYLLEDSGAELLLAQRYDQVFFVTDIPILDLSDEQQWRGGSLGEGSELEETAGDAGESESLNNLHGTGSALTEEDFPVKAASTDLAHVMYTSGTTGNPKGVMIEHRNIVRLAKNRSHATLDEDTRLLQTGAVVFDASTFEIWGTLLNGGQLHLVSYDTILDTVQLKQAIQQHSINTLFLTTSLFHQHSQQDIDLFTPLKELIVGGDVLSVPHLNRVMETHPQLRIINAYGPTENTVFSTIYDITEPQTQAVPIGRPIDHSTTYIVNRALKLQPVGAWGELLVGGDGVARGYLNRPELTADKFIVSPYRTGEYCYRTGDLARWRADGVLEYKGRIDEQVKIRGYRIELGEIESRLSSVAGVKESIVVVRQDELGQKQLCAYYVTDREMGAGQLRQALSQDLPGYMVPSYFVQLGELPLTPNGKVDRKALPSPEQHVDSGMDYVAPQTEVQQALADAWGTILGLQRVGIQDNFFHLGGDSIKAIQVSSRLFQAGHRLEMKDLFKYPTIAELSTHVQPVTQLAEQGEVSGVVRLTPIQRWFFEQQTAEPHHFNQSVMLYRPEGYDEHALRHALQAITTHHDALRIVFHTANRHSDYMVDDDHVQGEITAWNRRTEDGEAYHLEVYDCMDLNEAERTEQIEALCNELQASISLEQGPLMRLGLFRCPDGDHLLMVIHHLVVDGVSWRILFEDLAAAYEQASQGAEIIQLPHKTDSFQTWAQQLRAYAEGPAMEQEQTYWAAIAQTDVAPLPVDYDQTDNDQAGERMPLIADSETVTAVWSMEETEQLLKLANRTYRTEMNDLLLTAVGMALQAWSGQERFLIQLEGHGREHIIPEVDISRTIGWFTTQYPVLLDMPQAMTLGQRIKHVKEGLRSVPNKGIGYGILKYMTDSGRLLSMAELEANPEISFNYLGQFDQDMESNELQSSSYNGGMPLSPTMARAYTLDFNGMISGGQLGLTISYSTTSYRSNTMEALARLLEASLREILLHCISKEQPELTPSDISYKGLDVDSLDRLLAEMNVHGEVVNVYGLTPMQKGMLFHSQLDRQMAAHDAYVEQFSYDLQGKLNIQAFAESLNMLVQRHEALRAHFYFGRETEPLQVIYRSRECGFIYEDLRELASEEQEARLAKFKLEDQARGFDLRRDVLLRVAVLHTSEDNYRFIWSFHHIVMDGWCLSLVNKEVFEGYAALQAGQMPELAPPVPYSRFIEWLEAQDRQAAVDHWKDYLTGYDQQTLIPGTISAQSQRTEGYAASDWVKDLDRELTRQVEDTAKHHQVTMNILLQAAWGIVLQKYNQHEDVLFGSVVSGRPSDINGVEEMIGLFINTIPVRVRSEAGESFAEVMKRMQEQAMASHAYDTYPLFEIQALTDQKQTLIQHIMVFENYPVDEQVEQLGHKEEALFSIDNVTVFEQTNYDFNLAVMPGEGLRLSIGYNALVYSEADIERIAGHFAYVLQQVVANPDMVISDIRLATPQEEHEILHEFNSWGTEQEVSLEQCSFGRIDRTDRTDRTDRAHSSTDQFVTDSISSSTGEVGQKLHEAVSFTLHELFEEQAARTPELDAVVFEDTSLSYDALNRRANQLARTLRDQGVKPDQCVALLTERSIEMIVGILAILKAGGAYVPIDPSYPSERIEYMLKDSGTAILMLQQGLAEDISFSGKKVVLDLPEVYAQEDSNLPSVAGPEHLMYVLYTSGTTGLPKGVMVAHRSVANTVNWFADRYADYVRHRIVLTAEYTFDPSVEQIFAVLLHGGELHCIRRDTLLSKSLLLRYISKHDIGMLDLPPVLMRAYLAEEPKLDSLETLISGGERLEDALKDVLLSKGYRLHNHYGPTETTIDALATECEQGTAVHLGKPIRHTGAYILNAHRQLQPVGVVGELFIAGAGLARGYLNRSELTMEKFVEHPYLYGQIMYATGDLARWLPDGNVEFVGRMDDQVKVRGFRIELGEVEAQLAGIPSVRDCAVIAVADGNGQHQLCAYFTADASLTVRSIREQLAGALPGYMIPSTFVQVERMPLTTSGKIDRKALPAPEAGMNHGTEYVAPHTDVEQMLASIWQEVLDLPQVGIHDDFFMLGGHSLKVLELVRKIQLATGIELPIRTVLDCPTIEEQALELMKAELETGQDQPILRLNDHGYATLFCFPPMLGYALSFAELAKQLDEEAVLYGLEFPEEAMDERKLLASYVDLIVNTQSTGPYMLLGYSIGGNLAHKVAAALEEQGHSVAGIIILDSVRSTEYSSTTAEETTQEIEAMLEQVPEAYRELLNDSYRRKMLAYAVYGNQLLNTECLQADIYGLVAVGSEAVKGSGDNRLLWKDATQGSYVEQAMIGNHYELLEPGFVEENAKSIRKIIRHIWQQGEATEKSRLVISDNR